VAGEVRSGGRRGPSPFRTQRRGDVERLSHASLNSPRSPGVLIRAVGKDDVIPAKEDQHAIKGSFCTASLQTFTNRARFLTGDEELCRVPQISDIGGYRQINRQRSTTAKRAANRMSTYHATEPPDGATCDAQGCCTVAKVRALVPGSRFEADGIDHDQDPSVFDACELHWTSIRDACRRNGHTVLDITGDLRQLVAEFPDWTIFWSDGGRLYASPKTSASRLGTTVHSFLVSQLRRQMLTLAHAQLACND
jgi:hypothetical protein